MHSDVLGHEREGTSALYPRHSRAISVGVGGGPDGRSQGRSGQQENGAIGILAIPHKHRVHASCDLNTRVSVIVTAR